MLNSMTGYGAADGFLDGICYVVEIKAVNNRYLKTIIKLPETIAFLEEAIDKCLRTNLARGTVNCVVRLKGVTASTLFEIDEVALQSVVERLNVINSSLGIEGTIDLAALLDLPGVVHPVMPDEEESRRVRELVLSITQEAVDKLKQMREAEGKFLEADLVKNCEAMAKELAFVREQGEGVMLEYAKRLRKRVDTLLAEAKLKLDEETLAREAAILADRSDIAEEIARLDAHLEQFRQICATEGQAGRRLDFLSQEMLREANTMASKAVDAEIVRRVVDMKCLIERLKEQIQNVE
jgi:uncharacterized protein (TIGR00255 family)